MLGRDRPDYDEPRVPFFLRPKFIGYSLVILGAFVILLSGIFIVPEGHVGVVTRFAKAIYQAEPGLHFRIPVVDHNHNMDIRERKTVSTMEAVTSNRLPVKATISVNWRLEPSKALDIYKKYGKVDKFEAVVLAPRIAQAVKAAIPQFDPDTLFKNRNAAKAEVEKNLHKELSGYPVVIISMQLENIALPPRYLDSINAKLVAFENSRKEEYVLKQQKLRAQQAVQTATAERDAKKAKADGEAYAKKVVAEAEAYRIKLIGQSQADAIAKQREAIGDPASLVLYKKWTAWNGTLPQTMLSNDTKMLMSLPK